MLAPPTAALAIAATLAVGGSLSCGGEKSPGDDSEVKPATPITEIVAGRLVVAEVNGEPIYDSCVINQVAAHNLSKAEAVSQCIDFALLAQEAAARGYADHPEVSDARKTETVRALIDGDFTASFATPDDVPEEYLREHWKQWANRLYNVPEHRTAEWVRIQAQGVARDSAEDLAARAISEDLYAALADKRDLTVTEFRRIATEAANGHPLAVNPRPFEFARRGGALPAFADATFAIAEVGRVSTPTRTKYGWDVILLTKIVPARSATYTQALPEMRERIFTMSRRRAFARWMVKSTGDPEFDDDRLERLVAVERAQALLPEGDPPP